MEYSLQAMWKVEDSTACGWQAFTTAYKSMSRLEKTSLILLYKLTNMKSFLIFYLLLTAACSDNKTPTTTDPTNNSTSEKKSDNPSSTSAQADDIVGEWEMVGSVGDSNDNLQIDETERKNLKQASFKDYMKLNGDGSGLFTVAKMEGRYEAKESGGKRSLTWYDSGNGRHRIGTIISVSKEELHIKEPGGNGLFIWKRL